MILLQLIIFIIWSFFPWLGDDYDNYMVLISRPELALAFNIEPISLLIIFLINITGLSADWFFVAHAGILVFFLGRIKLIICEKFSLRNQTKIFLFLLIALFYVGPGISIIRQSVASAILTYAVLARLLYPSRRQDLVYFVTVILAAAFHYSAFPVGLVFYVFVFSAFSRFQWHLTFLNSLLLVLFVLLSSEIVKFGSSDNIYSSHLGGRAAIHQVSLVFYMTTIVYFAIVIAMILQASKLVPVAGKGIVFLCVNTVLLGGSIKLVAAEYLIFNRLVFYFNPFLLIGISLIVDRVKQQYIPYIVGIVFVGLLTVLILEKRGYFL